MSDDRAEFASSKFVNAIGENKDVQFVEKDLRSLLTALEIPLGVSSDAVDLSPSEHCSWNKSFLYSCYYYIYE